MKRALIVGLGSIGMRHLRILQSIESMEIVALRSLREGSSFPAHVGGGVREAYSFAEAISPRPDFAIVATPTSAHLEVCELLAAERVPFLLEKPVSDSLEPARRLARNVEKSGVPVLVGYQLRHHPGFEMTQKMISNGEIGRALHCLGYVGQYLPDWRPGTDYTKNYSAIRSMGGGVVLDLSHEIDLVRSLMGPVTTVSCRSGRVSDLSIDTEDFADILLGHGAANSNVHLNCLERSLVWHTHICGEQGSIIWDYGNDFVLLKTPNRPETRWAAPRDFDRNALFKKQMQHFMDVVFGGIPPRVSLRDSIDTLEISLAAMKSQIEGNVVRISQEQQES